MDTEERAMLRSSLRRLLVETDAAKLWDALAEFGWHELFAGEPHEAVPALFETQGETLVASPALGLVMGTAARAGGDGDPTPTAVLPGPGAGTQPASTLIAGTLHFDGYLAAGAAAATPLVVAARRSDELVVVAVDPDDPLPGRRVEGIDPWLELVHLEGRLDFDAGAIVDGPEAAQGWERAVAAGRRALAHELVGVAGAMLDLAVDHARERSQFGRPIGTFQALQHRLAEARVALTAAEAAAAEAWEGPETVTALLAKLWAGRAARVVGKHTQQALGGMGFTWEHRFHRYFRRALALDSLLGSAPELTAELGRELMTAGDIPRLASI
jgi:alkylation response protein AidB-like acyl-CoA dehydrogenase